MDSIAIQSILPHRYPFMLVDRVLEVVPEKRIVAFKNITYNEPHLQGHFPGAPIMPGVLIVEALAQTAGLLVARSVTAAALSGKIMYLAGLNDVRFRRKVVPGDRLVLEVEVAKHKAGVWKFNCVAKVDDEQAAEATITVAMGDLPKATEQAATPAPAPAQAPVAAQAEPKS